jgi:hypothetical protein
MNHSFAAVCVAILVSSYISIDAAPVASPADAIHLVLRSSSLLCGSCGVINIESNSCERDTTTECEGSFVCRGQRWDGRFNCVTETPRVVMTASATTVPATLTTAIIGEVETNSHLRSADWPAADYTAAVDLRNSDGPILAGVPTTMSLTVPIFEDNTSKGILQPPRPLR